MPRENSRTRPRRPGQADLVEHLVHPAVRDPLRRGEDPQMVTGPAPG